MVQEQKKVRNIKNSIVMFYRPMCPYCQHVLPFFDELSEEQKDRLEFITINIDDDAPTFKKRFAFATVPTIIYYKDGQEMLRHGSKDASLTKQEMEENITNIFS